MLPALAEFDLNKMDILKWIEISWSDVIVSLVIEFNLAKKTTSIEPVLDYLF